MIAMLAALWPALRSYWSYGALLVVSAFAWHFDARAVANAETVRVQAASFKQAQAMATQIAQAALQHEQAQYQAKATEADSAYQAQLADARGAADRYIASHRVQPAAASRGADATSAPAEGGGSPVPASVPSDAVVVSTEDVQACTAVTAYALKAHSWAATINP